MSLKLSELDPLYRSVSHEEALIIANLGAQCYIAAKERLYDAWSSAQTEDDAAQAELWRKEGGQAMAESLKARLAAGEAASARLAAIQGATEVEVTRRVEEVLAFHRKEFEAAKQKEIHGLETQIAEMRGAAKFASLLEESHASMKSELVRLSAEVTKYKEAAGTKSSHALGKIGEATIFEMLNSYVLPQFAYSEVRDMTAIKHVGDFHLFVNGPDGKRVKIMIDAKKYSSPVQNGEVEKLYSDLDGDDSEAGLMVSLDTPIYTKAQCQITKTKKGKPCMFISFEKLDDGIRQEVLCWAIRVLVSVVAARDKTRQDVMVADIQKFLGDLSAWLTELDTVVKSAKGLYDTLRDMKERLVIRMNSYRSSCGMDELTPEVALPGIDMRCNGKKLNGDPCRSRRMPAGLYCSRHATAEAVEAKKPDAIVLEE